MTLRKISASVLLAAASTPAVLEAGNLVGHVYDRNWYASRASGTYGVGYYEFAVNANGENLTTSGGSAATDVFGHFSMNALPAGSYTVASWDVWWRSAYAFGVAVPASGNSRMTDLRLNAAMWGYPAFWDDTGYVEFGQTFEATGPISMIYLRCPYDTPYRLTVHEDGPGGRQVGVARDFRGGDQRPIYGYGDMPTVAGQTYYVRVRSTVAGVNGVIMQMDPRPDFSDPMPGGCLWMGSASVVRPYPDRDLGLVIMSDDDGLITNLYARSGGGSFSGATSVGQTFIARGLGIISAAVWVADPTAPVYVVKVLAGGPGGSQVGTTKKGRAARVGADPEMLVTWAPGECPLTPGQTYYLEITRETPGGLINSIYTNPNNPYRYGQAYRNSATATGVDLAGTIMEEESQGSAAMPQVRIVDGPSVAEIDREAGQLTVKWETDVEADGLVEYAPDNPPYTGRVESPGLARQHSVTLAGLRQHTMYHFRVQSAAPNMKRVVSRDAVICTRGRLPNLLRNPGFEEGTGASPRRSVTGWTKSAGLDMACSDGSWFWGMKPREGSWLLEGAANANESDGYIYQRVPVTPGKEYTFSAWVTTWMRENDAYKYDVWNDRNRLIYMRLGIDPTGGTTPTAPRVQWTPRMYSHMRFTDFAKTVRAAGGYLTVFISFQGDGGQWHLYGVDGCVLTEKEAAPPQLSQPARAADGSFAFTVTSEPGATNCVEASTNLVTWEQMAQIVNTNGTRTVTDTNAPAFPLRFYRAWVP